MSGLHGVGKPPLTTRLPVAVSASVTLLGVHSQPPCSSPPPNTNHTLSTAPPDPRSRHLLEDEHGLHGQRPPVAQVRQQLAHLGRAREAAEHGVQVVHGCQEVQGQEQGASEEFKHPRAFCSWLGLARCSTQKGRREVPARPTTTCPASQCPAPPCYPPHAPCHFMPVPPLPLSAPCPILFTASVLGLTSRPSASNAFSSKKKEMLLALSKKYWSVLAVCRGLCLGGVQNEEWRPAPRGEELHAWRQAACCLRTRELGPEGGGCTPAVQGKHLFLPDIRCFCHSCCCHHRCCAGCT